MQHRVPPRALHWQHQAKSSERPSPRAKAPSTTCVQSCSHSDMPTAFGPGTMLAAVQAHLQALVCSVKRRTKKRNKDTDNFLSRNEVQ
jgi:hypothetical protein